MTKKLALILMTLKLLSQLVLANLPYFADVDFLVSAMQLLPSPPKSKAS